MSFDVYSVSATQTLLKTTLTCLSPVSTAKQSGHRATAECQRSVDIERLEDSRRGNSYSQSLQQSCGEPSTSMSVRVQPWRVSTRVWSKSR